MTSQDEEPVLEEAIEPIEDGNTSLTSENVETLLDVSPSTRSNIFKRPDLADKRRG